MATIRCHDQAPALSHSMESFRAEDISNYGGSGNPSRPASERAITERRSERAAGRPAEPNRYPIYEKRVSGTSAETAEIPPERLRPLLHGGRAERPCPHAPDQGPQLG
jgi:hypothetical protein